MPDAKSWRNSPLGNIIILAVTAGVVLLAVWLVGFARGTGTADQGSDADGGSQVSAVDIEDSEQPAPKVGEPAPQFTARTLDGEEFDLALLGGKPAWLVFNATWCSNCRAEIPDIQKTFTERSEEVHILSVYVSDNPSAVVEYSEKLGLRFPQVIDSDNRIAALYRVMALPTHYFLDSSGNISEIRVGTLSESQIDEALTDLGVAAQH